MPYFDLKPTHDGLHMFNLKADNNQIVLTSERYLTRDAAMSGIASVRANALNDLRYIRLIAANGSTYFVLKAANGEAIGVSELYASPSGRDAAIAFVKQWGPWAKVRE